MMEWIRRQGRRGNAALRRRYVSRGLILIYHRVASDPIDPWGLSVAPDTFSRHMAIIREAGYRPMHVSEMAKAVRNRTLVRRTIGVTFDDGYFDNLDAARPILERYDMPATHFATAGYIGSNEPFWWDVLDAVFVRARRLPETLEITIAGQPHSWTLGGDAELGTPKPDEWKPLGRAHTRRHEVHDTLWRLMAEGSPDDRQTIVRRLIDWAELAPKNWAYTRPMTEAELLALRGDGLVEIGAHSMSHPALSALPHSMQAYEMSASKARLEEILSANVRGFAFPLGRASPDVVRLAQEVGYDFACGSTKQAVNSSTNVFDLPRVSIKNWDGEQFRSLLHSHVAA